MHSLCVCISRSKILYLPIGEDVCIIEEGMDYSRLYEINSGDPEPDWESCQAFCRRNYPTAKFFKYRTIEKKCWCTTSNKDRQAAHGVTSGVLHCPGKLSYSGNERDSQVIRRFMMS